MSFNQLQHVGFFLIKCSCVCHPQTKSADSKKLSILQLLSTRLLSI